MKPFTTLTGAAVPLGLKNVDTDLILPAAQLKVLSRTGLGRYAFTTIRYDDHGAERPGSIFNLPRYRGAPIIIARENFGCGSSREHAAWALDDMGVRAVIAPSFGDIFSGNAFRNGILTVALREAEVEQLLKLAESADVTIDLAAQTVAADGVQFAFDVDPFRKNCLLDGTDEISLTEQLGQQIEAHERKVAAERPWVFSTREG